MPFFYSRYRGYKLACGAKGGTYFYGQGEKLVRYGCHFAIYGYLSCRFVQLGGEPGNFIPRRG